MSKVMKIAPFIVLCALMIAVPSVWANWIQDGVALCTATGNQFITGITSDGEGGAIVTWYDYRFGSNVDIYAQRVNASGSAQWTTDGVALCRGRALGSNQQITSDGEGGAIVTWDYADSGVYYIYAQRVNASGSVQWAANGVVLCTVTPGDVVPHAIVSDGAGGVLVTWNDYRSGFGGIYAQRVNASGVVQWMTNGVACAATSHQELGQISSDGAGGAIVAWCDTRNGNPDIYAQRVNASGSVQWTTNGVALCTATGFQGWQPRITSDGAGGAIVTWYDARAGELENGDIYAQRVNASGSVQWTTDGVALCTATGATYLYLQITSDGAGDAIVSWQDTRGIYAQKVNAWGAVQWWANGVALCTAMGNQFMTGITCDGEGGAIVTWMDSDSLSGNYDIYAQKVDASGDVPWTTDGVVLCTTMGPMEVPQITSDGEGGAIISWCDYRSGTDLDVYAQRVDAAGHTVVATLLQNYAAIFSGDRIAITWTLSEIDEGIELSVERATASDGPFMELPSSALSRDKLSFTFTDNNWQPNMSYLYRVEYQIGGERKVLFETGPIATPALPLTLNQNSPNPFNPSTTIRYSLPEKCRVKLEIYDSSGRRMASLVNGEQEKGRYAAEWNGKDERGNSVASGIYFYKLMAGKETVSRKMVLLR
jgi:hypothetical protein